MNDEKTKNALRRLHRKIAEYIDPDVEIGIVSFGNNKSEEEELERLETIKIIRKFRPAERKRYLRLKKKLEIKIQT